MIIKKFTDKSPKLLIFQGSPRKENSCANQISKSEKICNHIYDNWSSTFDIEMINLNVGKVIIQPCKGCISTSGGMHCHWFCSCYSKGSTKKPDLMYEADVYKKLEECDAFLVVTPIHWYSVTSQVKAMFDRLVCANQTITKEEANSLFGKGNIKNSEVTGQAELSGKYKSMVKNHLSGKWAAFYAHGDNGGNDYNGNQPETGDKMWDVKNSIMPLVYQCRYSDINCPDDLVEAFYINEGRGYYESNLEMDENSEFFDRADKLLEKISTYLEDRSNSSL